MIHLQAPDLGSLNSGSLVYFRKIPVGRVYDYTLNANNFRLSIQGDEMIFRFAFARHHTDIVTADQRIQPGNAGQSSGTYPYPLSRGRGWYGTGYLFE
jgi:ABC-type transporter Mla subunit MlaD